MCQSFDLIWYPKRRHARAAAAHHSAAEHDALVLYRRHDVDGSARPAFVEAGVDLLPAQLRETCLGARLVWVPTDPTRCILVRRDRSGVLQLGATPWVRPGALAEPMAQLDTACAAAVGLALEDPATADLRDQLAVVLTLTLQVIGLFTGVSGGHGAPAQLEAP